MIVSRHGLSGFATSAILLIAALRLAGAQAQPATWSVRVAASVMRRSPAAVYEKWDYTAGLMLLALQRVSESTHDPKYAAYIRASIDSLVRSDGTIATYASSEYNLDQINEGRALLTLYDQTHNARYARAADRLSAQLRSQPRTAEGGFWHKQIYPQQMWLDGLYMAEPFYAEYAATFHEEADFEDIARQFLLMEQHARDAKTGLLYHGWDESRRQRWADPRTGRSPNFWGRAVGWYALALVDALDYFPQDHPRRAELLAIL